MKLKMIFYFKKLKILKNDKFRFQNVHGNIFAQHKSTLPIHFTQLYQFHNQYFLVFYNSIITYSPHLFFFFLFEGKDE